MHSAATLLHGLHMRFDASACPFVDHRANVHRQICRCAQRVFSHRALQHLDQAVCHIVLHTEHAQGRAALACGFKGRGHGVGDDLFQQGRRVDHHAVLPAGLGDQRHGLAVRVQAFGQRGLQHAGGLGGAGEHHALHAGIAYQLHAHFAALARQQLYSGPGHARLPQGLHGQRGDGRR